MRSMSFFHSIPSEMTRCHSLHTSSAEHSERASRKDRMFSAMWSKPWAGGRKRRGWVSACRKINSISSGFFLVPDDHYSQILVFKSNPCLLGFISNIKNALKNLKTQYRNQDMNFTNNIWSYAAGNAFGWMDTNLANLKIISFSKLGRLMMRFVHS